MWQWYLKKKRKKKNSQHFNLWFHVYVCDNTCRLVFKASLWRDEKCPFLDLWVLPTILRHRDPSRNVSPVITVVIPDNQWLHLHSTWCAPAGEGKNRWIDSAMAREKFHSRLPPTESRSLWWVVHKLENANWFAWFNTRLPSSHMCFISFDVRKYIWIQHNGHADRKAPTRRNAENVLHF